MLLNKWNFCLVLLLSIFATACGGFDLTQEQQSQTIGENGNGQQQVVVTVQDAEEIEAYPERYKYQTIPLENINFALQGSDPAALALNALDEQSLAAEKHQVEVVYPQPNQALVKVTQTKLNNNSFDTIHYRVEMTTFGRSLLTNSPPMWQIVWAGSQVQCSPGSNPDKELTQSCQ
ncbi:hypothetical protein [Nodularia sp. NIES-3585]|uniref:hypothetical protein n=1 Tax=Nodularia sp. NIES-3585 TaxID=1973477 RepID=UPI000B5C5EFD|nr:hypothetical protein [Nodularia sp. NIES-3585]GAX36405.1 hypothetical protein NIES3585_24350 [Nodularia sp. NIES-3585]